MRRLAILLAITVAACGEAPGVDSPVVRDSAGVRITENAVPLDDLPAWTPELQLEIADERLYRVRGVTRLPDGDILVMNQGSLELLRYGPDGSFVQAIGREGEGPGEFQWPMGLWTIPGDTIMAWDPGRKFMNLYALDGRYVRGFRINLTPFSDILGPLGDGTLLVAQDEPVFGLRETRMMYREILKYDLQGQLLDSLGRHPARVAGPLNLPGGRQAWGSLEFGAFTVHAIGPRGYWVGTAQDYEVRRYDLSGALAQVIRWEGPDRAVTDEDRGSLREYRLSLAEDAEGRKRVREQMDAMSFADRMRAYSRLHAGPDSTLWVREFDPPPYPESARWLVFDPDGKLIGRAELPAWFSVYEVGRDYVLGVFRDEMRVERVRLYGLVGTE